jgi:hypothetical protein
MSVKTLLYVVAGIVIVVAVLTRLLFAHDFLEFLRVTF